MNSTSAVADFIQQALAGDVIRIRDDGQAVRSYCYVADAVVGLWKVLFHRPPGGAFNIGSDREAVSFLELAERIGRCLGKSVRVVAEGAPASGILGSRYCPDVTRLSRETGFRPSTGLDEALGRTIAWMKDRGTS
jgi:nucleoside-diphosphate-sugar epimerase